jgi:allophanate hydrolase subunit 1
MTKIQLQYHLTRPLDEKLLEAISRANSVYGIERITLAPAMDKLLVEYDATRMNPNEVQAVLLRSGIPVDHRA